MPRLADSLTGRTVVVVLPEPPADADDWTDDEWLAWLRATDEPEAETTPVPPSWHDASAGTQFLAAAMIGLARAIYGPKATEVAIVQDAEGDPLGDQPLEIHLDPDRPADSFVIVRPWLLDPRTRD